MDLHLHSSTRPAVMESAGEQGLTWRPAFSPARLVEKKTAAPQTAGVEVGLGQPHGVQTDLTREPGSIRSTALPEAATQPVIALWNCSVSLFKQSCRDRNMIVLFYLVTDLLKMLFWDFRLMLYRATAPLHRASLWYLLLIFLSNPPTFQNARVSNKISLPYRYLPTLLPGPGTGDLSY